MATKADPLALQLLQEYDSQKSKRVSKFDDGWQQISDLMLPQDSNITAEKTNESIQEWTAQVFDTTAIQAAQTFMSGLYNWTTPQQQPWAGYASSKSLGDVGLDAAEFWDLAAEDVMAAFGRSNFYSMRALSCLGLGVFGTDFMLFEEDEDAPGEFNFRHNRISTYVIEENYKGVVDSTKREFEMTYRQIKQQFKGKGEIPEDMRAAAEGGSKGSQKKFKILHCIFPRKDWDRLKGRKDGANKPVGSVYLSMDFKQTMRIGGYDEECQLVPRFAKWGTESPYGFGPAYIALCDARELNFMAMYMHAAAEKLIDPRVLVPSNLEGDVDMRAGGVTVWDENVPDGKPSEWASATEYKLGREIMEDLKASIREAFLVTAFKFLNSQPLLDKRMTAYEVSQRLAEQLQGATPAIARSEAEFTRIAMHRAFGIRYRAGKDDPKSIYHKIPDSLMKRDRSGKVLGLKDPDIVVTSRFSDAMKALKNRAAEEFIQFIMPQVETFQRPDLLDPFDLDKLNTRYGLNTGLDADIVKDEKGPNGYLQIRQKRQQMQQAAAAAQQAETLGKAGAGLGKSPKFLQDKAEETLSGKK